MRNEAIEHISKITRKAINGSGEFQPWKDYFRLRAKEIELFLSLYDFKKIDRLLEIGCGNGFNAALFSPKANRIFATDLYKKEHQRHSIGIEKAKGLLNKLEIKNCYILSCSGMQLPFRDNSFDCVLAIYVLEHIDKRWLFIKEEKRVLKRGGIGIHFVPNFVERLFYPPLFYIDILKKLFRYFSKNDKNKPLFSAGNDNAIQSAQDRKDFSLYNRFRRDYPHFPMPEPHGEYNSFFIELKEYIPQMWLNLFKRGGMEVEDVFSTMIIPKAFLELFTDSLRFYEKYAELDKKLGKLPLLRFLGQNLCIVTRKA